MNPEKTKEDEHKFERPENGKKPSRKKKHKQAKKIQDAEDQQNPFQVAETDPSDTVDNRKLESKTDSRNKDEESKGGEYSGHRSRKLECTEASNGKDSETKVVPGNLQDAEDKKIRLLQVSKANESDTVDNSKLQSKTDSRNEDEVSKGGEYSGHRSRKLECTEASNGKESETKVVLGNQRPQDADQSQKPDGRPQDADQSKKPDGRQQDADQSQKPDGRPQDADQSQKPDGRPQDADQSQIPDGRTQDADQSQNPDRDAETPKAEKLFTFVFWIFLGFLNFCFALASGISALMVIRNLEPLHHYIFESISFHNVTETSSEISCSQIKHAVWSLCIVMIVPTILTLVEARSMISKYRKEKFIKKILVSIIAIDILGFAAQITSVLLFLPAFDPYIAAVLYFVFNPTYFRFSLEVNKECFLNVLTIISNVFVGAGVFAFIGLNFNGESSGILIGMLICVTAQKFIWNNFVNTKGDDKTIIDKNTAFTPKDGDKQHPEENNGNQEVKKIKSDGNSEHSNNDKSSQSNVSNEAAANNSAHKGSLTNEGLTSKDGERHLTENNDNQEKKKSRNNENIGLSNDTDKNQKKCNEKKCFSILKDDQYYVTAAGLSSIVKVLGILAVGIAFHFKDIKINSSQGSCNCHYPYCVAGVNIVFSFMCYLFSKTACKILKQKWCFATPLTISVIVTPVVLYLLDHVVRYFSFITIDPFLPGMSRTILQFESNPGSSGVLLATYVCACGFFILSIRHSFESKGRPPGCRFRLFIKPMYTPLFTAQSLLLNRRRVDEIDCEKGSMPREGKQKLYICATMWHEKRKEMSQLITSILRMDKAHPHYDNSSEVDLEVHIIVDDAFDEYGVKLNRHVEELCDILKKCDRHFRNNDSKKESSTTSEASQSKTEQNSELQKPTAIRTPYGGRLVWTLPSDNNLIVHLKDTNRVRKKKRWSQIFFMHYLLKFLTTDNQNSDNQNTGNQNTDNQKTDDQTTDDQTLNNSFVLVLDGDVSFKPKAVRLLIERMQKNEKVGAACGRIHPKGSGPMVWFQKFEYAISHWLQKSTEHVFGCVLCSPGCFSLFRASAINKTIEKYSRKPNIAEEYVRFDQGEDRWYSQILLQAGYKIEYCAAADAQTYAPEGFFELYKQRRRWTPSTLGNILAIIMKSAQVIKSNDNISKWYIRYQKILFITSILTPGTIFLLLLGSIMTAFPAIDPLGALMINLIPVALFTLSCLVFGETIQLYVAGLLSNIYALMMLAVLVGLLQISVEAGFCSLTTVFMIYVASIFVVAAILHPKEFKNLLYGPVYFLAIPSTSMLMMIYALTNLHVISWGTRETESKPSTGKSHSVFRKIGKYLCCRPSGRKELDLEKGENENNENDNCIIKFDTQKMHQKATDKTITCLWRLRVGTAVTTKDYDLILRNQDTGDEIKQSSDENKTRCTFRGLAADTNYQVSLIATFLKEGERVFWTTIKTKQKNFERHNINLKVPAHTVTDSSANVEWSASENVKKYHMEWRETESKKFKDECEIRSQAKEKHICNLSPRTSYQVILTVTFGNNEQYVEEMTFTTKELQKWFESKEFKYETGDNTGDPKARHTCRYGEKENDILEDIKGKYIQVEEMAFMAAKEEKNRIHGELLVLRSKICVMFIMSNILFVTIIYILTHISTYQGTLSITLWCQSEDVASQTKLEPISITFIVMFGLLLLIQFVSMIFHRISTLIQVLASNENKNNIDANKKRKNQTTETTPSNKSTGNGEQEHKPLAG